MASTSTPSCPVAPSRPTLGLDANSSNNQGGYARREEPEIPEHLIAPFTVGMRLVVRNRTNGAYHHYNIIGARTGTPCTPTTWRRTRWTNRIE